MNYPTIAIAEVSDITVVMATSNNISPKNLSESFETKGSSDSGSQLVGCTPTHDKTPITTSQRPRQLNGNLSTTGEVTLDEVHNNLTKMIGSVLERLENTEQRLNSLEQ